MIFIIFIAIAIASYAVQASLESKFKRYSRIPVNGNLTGAQVAERMLREQWQNGCCGNTAYIMCK